MPTTVSQAKADANRANAQSSTGPRTDTGKEVSSHNALKTGLAGRTVLLPTEEADRYEQHLEHYRRLWSPIGEHETNLVQAIADCWWRLQRIPALESALYANGRNKFADIDPEFIELETYLAYEKQFKNLALQERRLSIYAARLKAELEEMQKTRRDREAEETPDQDQKRSPHSQNNFETNAFSPRSNFPRPHGQARSEP